MKDYFITNSVDSDGTLYITSVSMTSASMKKIDSAILRYKKKLAPDYVWNRHVSIQTVRLHDKGGKVNIVTDSFIKI